MATHDYVIDNQSASAFRGDLNSVLQAILTQNSSATAPTTATANMIWYDTTNKQLKKRNEAGSAWITLGTINEGAGTFTPSGERALASQAQAEAGTDNTTVMTPLRVAEAIDAQVDATKVGLATAGLAYGAVGTYAYLNRNSTSSLTAGTTYAGSGLSPAGGYTSSPLVAGVGQTSGAVRGASTLSGTWRLMGSNENASDAKQNVFLRIS